MATSSTATALPACQVVFVVGAPGSGKGTTCKLLTERLLDDNGRPKFAHLSARDLLREERNNGSDSELSRVINENIRKGALVPSDVMCRLIEQGMERVHRDNNSIVRFLIDGFPRSPGNAIAWRDTISSKHLVAFALNLTCPEEILAGRLLQRGKDATDAPREDDADLTIIHERFQNFQTDTAPLLEWYNSTEGKGLLKTVASDRTDEEVYRDVARLVQNLCP
mmetsp:Transcript_22751/g.26208  ORF Transcript_22751/g.26208 Transcript_22751/m.26208 type:complete len:223 (-) Transcript_22751:345-1013(-)|eukprot:CAMPEP_0194381622 /NCGR_PEP_ID=MMETSP0174-20130528/54401_1 /TAXON_ID=216777 /ORGANISM="Proboscia alata, Strain PI-D3" /LENGTH=222 /DNA_ID=CAMNT_0039166139 /DNA_START=52 /DNA_END=720 /DNA_ORIENTATION=+